MVDSDVTEKPETDVDLTEDDRLFCTDCGAPVTRRRFAEQRRGDHEHTVFNPAGRVFTIRCFADAPGATPVGGSTDEFSWFPGYAWRIAVCHECAAHLGWTFEGMDAFFGLIKDALSENPPS